MRVFRRKNQPVNAVERLTQEIQARRRLVHDAVDDMLSATATDGAVGGRVYQVFASFQADFPASSTAK